MFALAGFPWLDRLFVRLARATWRCAPVRLASAPGRAVYAFVQAHPFLRFSVRVGLCLAGLAALPLAFLPDPVLRWLALPYGAQWLPLFVVQTSLALSLVLALALSGVYAASVCRALLPVCVTFLPAFLAALGVGLYFDFPLHSPAAWARLSDWYRSGRAVPWLFGLGLVLPYLAWILAQAIALPSAESYVRRFQRICAPPFRWTLRLAPAALVVYGLYRLHVHGADASIAAVAASLDPLLVQAGLATPATAPARALVLVGALGSILAILTLGLVARIVLRFLTRVHARLIAYRRRFEAAWNAQREETARRVAHVAAVPRDTLLAAWGAFDAPPEPAPETVAPEPAAAPSGAPESTSDAPAEGEDSNGVSLTALRVLAEVDPDAEEQETQRRKAQTSLDAAERREALSQVDEPWSVEPEYEASFDTIEEEDDAAEPAPDPAPTAVAQDHDEEPPTASPAAAEPPSDDVPDPNLLLTIESTFNRWFNLIEDPLCDPDAFEGIAGELHPYLVAPEFPGWVPLVQAKPQQYNQWYRFLSSVDDLDALRALSLADFTERFRPAAATSPSAPTVLEDFLS